MVPGLANKQICAILLRLYFMLVFFVKSMKKPLPVLSEFSEKLISSHAASSDTAGQVKCPATGYKDHHTSVNLNITNVLHQHQDLKKMKMSDNVGFACTCQETDTKFSKPSSITRCSSINSDKEQTACLYQPL